MGDIVAERRRRALRHQLEVLEFTYRDGYPVRLVVIDDEPWFVVADLAKVLRAATLALVYGPIDDEDRIQVSPRCLIAGTSAVTGSSGGEIWLVSERAFYETVHSGSVPGWDFKRWVTHEVLPTLRCLDVESVRRTDLPVIRRKVTFAKKARPRGVRTPHCLYRLFDDEGRLLYVGITWNVTQRMKGHRVQRPWWRDVSDVRVESYPSRAAALAAETEAIRTEKPLHNIAQKIT